MSGKIWGVFLAFVLFGNAYGQKSNIKGTVTNNEDKPLFNASVVVLQARDSFMVVNTRTDREGNFMCKELSDSAQYVLLFTYPEYVSFTYKVNMKDAIDGTADVGRIALPLKAILLQEVLVKSQTPIKIKGDTTEYNADSFQVHPNATVEDLLKQLPGLQVDQEGNVAAQGQQVKKVLVDGEEFFSEDPTLVTRNLRADMIDKVQVYDKKSDAAAFTGIEDGIKDKTINLKTKANKNNGAFGKIDVGGGNNHYNSQGMANFFKGKRRLSVLGSASNIGQAGLGFGDRWQTGYNDQSRNAYSSKGLPALVTGGTHYDKKWNNGKESINGNYRFTLSNAEGDEDIVSQNNLPSGVILSNTARHFNNSNTQHKISSKYINKLDSTFTFTAYGDVAWQQSKNQSNSVTQNRHGDHAKIYDNSAAAGNDNSSNAYSLRLQWEKRLKKKGRTISFYASDNFSQNSSDGASLSSSQFFDGNHQPERTAVLNLKKGTNNNRNSLSLNANYTEPLSKNLSLIVNYTLTNDGSLDDMRSYNVVNEQSAASVNPAFSTKMNTVVWGYQGGVALNFATPKVIAKAGNNVKDMRMNIQSMYDDMALKKQYTNWNPALSFRYLFNNYKNLTVGYIGNSINPQRSDLLPFKYNNSQLSTYLANYNLKNSFSHVLTANYNSSQITSETYFSTSANYTFTADPIAQSITVSPEGVYAYQSNNLNGYANRTYNANMSYSRKIHFMGMNVAVNTGLDGGRAFSPINHGLNELNFNTYSLGLNLHKSEPKKYSLSLDGQGNYTSNKSSLQAQIGNNYFSYTLKPTLHVFFLKKFEGHSEAQYLWQQKTQTFSHNFSRTIWTAWAGYKFLKNEQLMLRLVCRDILNQNNGYSRTASNTFYSEDRYTTIRRFFLLSLVWNFTKFSTNE